MEVHRGYEWVQQRMLRLGRARKMLLSDLNKNDSNLVIVRIARGFYLDATDLGPDELPWEIRRIVALARIFVVDAQVGTKEAPAIFTGECAAIAAQATTVWNVPNIAFRVNARRKHRRKLPAVTIAGVTVPATDVYHVTGGLSFDEADCVRVNGELLLAPPEVVVADECRREHPLKAFTVACTLLAQLTLFDRGNSLRARHEAQKTKEKWLRRAEEIRGGRDYRTFKAVVDAMDPGVDSPLEAMALWAVKVHLPNKTWDDVHTQFRVDTSNQVFFLDIAFPLLEAAVELDGRIKYGDSAEAADRYSAKHTNRHNSLTRGGWDLFHLTSADLGHPSMVVKVGRVLQELRVLQSDRPPKPRGPLFRPLPAALFSKTRRF